MPNRGNLAEKYYEPWFTRITENKTTAFLYFLKTASVEQIKEQAPKVSRFDWPSNDFGVEWESFVANDHTGPYLDEPIRKILEIHEVLQPITFLLFPNWIMDRFKEALDQHVRGEWLSSISLCGDIVEFIVNEFWAAHPNLIPKDQPKPPRKVMKALSRLLDFTVLRDDDYELLKYVRQRRDDHVHNYPRNFFLECDYPAKLRADSLESLKGLTILRQEQHGIKIPAIP